MVSSCGPDVCTFFFFHSPSSPFSLFLIGAWLRGDSYFANRRRRPLAGRRSLEQTGCQGKARQVPPEPSAPRWVEISCRLVQEDKGEGGHTFTRLITGASAAKAPEQRPLCVYMRRIISDKAIPASSPSLLLPLLLLFLRFFFVFAPRGLCPDERQSR